MADAESRRTFLVAEDEAMIAMLLEDILDAAGHDVAAVVDSNADAMAALERGGVDAAILDINLSDGESWALAAHLQQQGIPFLIASGDSAVTPPDGMAPVKMLAKPFSLASLEDAITGLDG
ncbi:MAG: response regulator [Pseudomonadota bacterium]